MKHNDKHLKQLVTATTLVISSLCATNTQAALTSYTNNGVDLVYSAVSDVTWLSDTNLLGTLMTTNGYSAMVDSINTASSLTVSTTDFDNTVLGRTNWYGAMAFVDYLNSSLYGGSGNWQLPTVTDLGTQNCSSNSSGNFNFGTDCGFNVYRNGTDADNELAELYYIETGSIASYNTLGNRTHLEGFNDTDNNFINLRSDLGHWSSTEASFLGSNNLAWRTSLNDGYQYAEGKTELGYSLPLIRGQFTQQVTAVPEPQTYAMLLAGLGVLGFRQQQRKRASNHQNKLGGV